MHNTLDNLVIYNGYPVSIVAAVSFHCLVLAAIVYFQSNSRPETLNLVQPTVVKALLIDVNPQVRNAQNLERQRLERLEQQRQSRQQELDRQAEAQRQLERERAAEQERAQAQQRQEQQRQRGADARRQQQDEADRQARAEAERRRQEQAAAQERQRQQAAQELATTEFELVQSATALIQQVVEENWSRPPSARNGMRAILQIRMLPTGELVSALITQSSGDAAFDRSAENAVYRAAPFRELQILPIKLFNANFRILSLIFEPGDLLN